MYFTPCMNDKAEFHHISCPFGLYSDATRPLAHQQTSFLSSLAHLEVMQITAVSVLRLALYNTL